MQKKRKTEKAHAKGYTMEGIKDTRYGIHDGRDKGYTMEGIKDTRYGIL